MQRHWEQQEGTGSALSAAWRQCDKNSSPRNQSQIGPVNLYICCYHYGLGGWKGKGQSSGIYSFGNNTKASPRSRDALGSIKLDL